MGLLIRKNKKGLLLRAGQSGLTIEDSLYKLAKGPIPLIINNEDDQKLQDHTSKEDKYGRKNSFEKVYFLDAIKVSALDTNAVGKNKYITTYIRGKKYDQFKKLKTTEEKNDFVSNPDNLSEIHVGNGQSQDSYVIGHNHKHDNDYIKDKIKHYSVVFNKRYTK